VSKKHGPRVNDPTVAGAWFAKASANRKRASKAAKQARKKQRAR
jgi:hypothetical protein